MLIVDVMISPPQLAARRLGKRRPAADRRTLRLSDYFAPRLAQAPSAWFSWRQHWPMFANDRLSNSPCAAVGHLALRLAEVRSEESEPDVAGDIAAMRRALMPAGAAARGLAATAVLNHWRQKGLGGRRLAAYAAIEPGNREQLAALIWQVGGVFCGLNLPLTARTDRVWSVPPDALGDAAAPGSWGGHAVAVIGFDHSGLIAVSWGTIQRITWEFWRRYGDEAYAVFPAPLDPEHLHLDGFDFAQLLADVDRITR